jgi:hypothetical protein
VSDGRGALILFSFLPSTLFTEGYNWAKFAGIFDPKKRRNKGTLFWAA